MSFFFARGPPPPSCSCSLEHILTPFSLFCPPPSLLILPRSSVNWKLFAFTVLTWCLTVPFCALLSGVLYAVIAYSPQASCDPITISLRSSAAQVLMINGVNVTAVGGQTYKYYPTNC